MSGLTGSSGTVGISPISLSREKRHLEPVSYNSIPKSINYNESYNSVSGQCAIVKEEEIFTNLMGLIKSMKETNFLVPGEQGYHTKYRWSFYEPFGIPAYSRTDSCLINNYRTLFKRFNYRDPRRTWVHGNPSNNLLDWFFDTEPETCAFNVFNGVNDSLNYDKYKHFGQPENLYLLINYKQPNIIKDNTNYKIHFMVDESFALYVLIKAMMIMHNRDKRRGVVRHLAGKILFAFRDSKFGQTGQRVPLFHRNTVVPTVVIYTSSDSAEETKEILEELIKAFPEYNEIGLMELGDSNKIAYGNIRLNKLISYAQGDRITKLKVKEKNYNTTVTKSISEKIMPPWVKNMISKCSSSESEINKRSQAFFGVNFCDKTYLNLPSACNIEPLCYFSVNETCLDPNTIQGVDDIEKTNEFSMPLTVGSVNKLGGMRKTRKRKSRSSRRLSRGKRSAA